MPTPPVSFLPHPQQGSPQHTPRAQQAAETAAGVAAKAVPAERVMLTAMILAKSFMGILQRKGSLGAAVASRWRRFGSDHRCAQGAICRRRIDLHRLSDLGQGHGNRQCRPATSVAGLGRWHATDQVIGATMARHHAIAARCGACRGGKTKQDNKDQEQQAPHGRIFVEHRDRVTSRQRVHARPASARTAAMPGATIEGPGSIGSRGTPRRFTHAVR